MGKEGGQQIYKLNKLVTITKRGDVRGQPGISGVVRRNERRVRCIPPAGGAGGEGRPNRSSIVVEGFGGGAETENAVFGHEAEAGIGEAGNRDGGNRSTGFGGTDGPGREGDALLQVDAQLRTCGCAEKTAPESIFFRAPL